MVCKKKKVETEPNKNHNVNDIATNRQRTRIDPCFRFHTLRYGIFVEWRALTRTYSPVVEKESCCYNCCHSCCRCCCCCCTFAVYDDSGGNVVVEDSVVCLSESRRRRSSSSNGYYVLLDTTRNCRNHTMERLLFVPTKPHHTNKMLGTIEFEEGKHQNLFLCFSCSSSLIWFLRQKIERTDVKKT